jgi:hypothetical protein
MPAARRRLARCALKPCVNRAPRDDAEDHLPQQEAIGHAASMRLRRRISKGWPRRVPVPDPLRHSSRLVTRSRILLLASRHSGGAGSKGDRARS